MTYHFFLIRFSFKNYKTKYEQSILDITSMNNPDVIAILERLGISHDTSTSRNDNDSCSSDSSIDVPLEEGTSCTTFSFIFRLFHHFVDRLSLSIIVYISWLFSKLSYISS